MNRLHPIKIGIFCLLAAATFSLSTAQAAETPTPKEIAALRSKAEKGDARAQFHLARSYGLGLGVPKDNAETVKWARKAAEQGHTDAQLELGYSYGSNVRGVQKDEAEGYKWFLLAEAQGNEKAKKAIKTIERRLTDAQRAEGQRLAREWKPSKPNSEIKPSTK